MKTGQMLHVLTDRNGNIIAAGLFGTGSAHATGAQVQITPMKGQSLVVVPMTGDLGSLEDEEDFRRLTKEFQVPRGKKELARKRGTGRSGKRR